MSRELTVDGDIVRFVQLGERVCTQFTVALPNRATFEAVMAAAMGANNFDPPEVARTIGALFDDAMQVQFGAEGSAVLYIEVPYFTGQRLAAPHGMGERYTDQQRQDYARRVIDWARTVHADEISVQQYPPTDNEVWGQPGEHPHRIRIWWD